MWLFRLILVTVLGYLLYKVLKPLFLQPSKRENVGGRKKQDDNIQKKHSDKIEDADFEEIE
jgi:hypothetical protein